MTPIQPAGVSHTAESREELLLQLVALFNAQSVDISDDVIILMKPLIDGSQDFAQHLSSLEYQLEHSWQLESKRA